MEIAKPVLDQLPEAVRKALQNNPDIEFMELSTEDTNPVITAGVRDEQIREMRWEALRKTLLECNQQEEHLMGMLTDLRKRRKDYNDILARKTELENGVCNRPG